MHGDRRIMLSGPSVAARRASAKNKQFYHDRCIAATPSKFLLQESKYGFAAPKSPCYSQPEAAIPNAEKRHCWQLSCRLSAKRKMNEQTSTTQAKGVKVMKLRLIATIVTGASAAMLASAAFGQANPQNSGYVLFGYGTPAANIWRSGSYGGTPGVNDTLCWRTGHWTPAMAIVECDPDLVPKPAPGPAPAVTPPPPPPPPAPAPAPAATVQKITLATKALFDFDKADLKPEGKAAIDREVI